VHSRSKSEQIAQERIDKQMAARDRRILLMDDEETIRDLVSEMLALLGYEVVKARDGEEVIRLYKEAREFSRPFDAVIMDLTVPGGMGGGETIQVLREIDPNVRAIVSSGYLNDPIMADYEAHGFRGVVRKPYTINELSAVLKQVVPPRN
jgi:two-component system, cell cycle sensor histidine kinase and response regulator CckA